MTDTRFDSEVHLTRRDALLAFLGLPPVLAACASSDARAEVVESTSTTVRGRIAELAVDDADAERLLDLFAKIERDAQDFVAVHAEFTDAADRLTKDRTTHDDDIVGLIERNSAARRSLRRRLLAHQHELKVALGPYRWSQLSSDLNDAEAMRRLLGRGRS